MKLIKHSLLLMASATLLLPVLASAMCSYPEGAVLPPASVVISPGCPARPAIPAPLMNSQYIYTKIPAPTGSWTLGLRNPPRPSNVIPTGSTTLTAYPQQGRTGGQQCGPGSTGSQQCGPAGGQMLPAQPSVRSGMIRHEPDTTPVVTFDVCLQDDGTWYTLDGTMSGGWSSVGGEVSLSGNNDQVGGSGILSVLEPGVSMIGDWQSWPVTDPTAEQNVYSTLWTVNSPLCSD